MTEGVFTRPVARESITRTCLRPRRRAVATVSFALAFTTAAPLAAQDIERGWSYSVSPYLWAAGLSGSTTPVEGLGPVEVDLSFGDVLKDLSFAAMVFGTAQNGRFGISADLLYVSTEDRSDLPGPAFTRANVNSDSLALSVYGDYLVQARPKSRVWVSAGARYWDVSTDVSLSGGIAPATALGSSDTWFDPVIGLRGRVDMSDRVYLTGWAFVGGFGVGSDSMTDVLGAVGYRFNDRVSAVIGYRYSAVDREKDRFVYDVEQQGVIGGVTINF